MAVHSWGRLGVDTLLGVGRVWGSVAVREWGRLGVDTLLG